MSPQMAELKVHIDPAQLDEMAQKKITELEHKLSLAEKREERAKKRVKELENNIECVAQARSLLSEVTWQLDEMFDVIPKDYA
jgi:hypothetical protein